MLGGVVDEHAMPPGPALLKVFPTTLIYKSPYGLYKQDFHVTLYPLTTQTVAYKVQARQELWRFYTVIPPAGVVHPGTTISVNFQLNGGFSPLELVPWAGKHVFQLNALFWPGKGHDFDLEMWNQIVPLVQGQIQTVYLESELNLSCHAGAIPMAMPMQPGMPPGPIYGTFMMAAPTPSMPPQPAPHKAMIDDPWGSSPQRTKSPRLAVTQRSPEKTKVGDDAGEEPPLEPKTNGPMQSEGPLMVEVSPTTLHFKAPYGKKSQLKEVQLKLNQSTKTAAFKVQIYKMAHKFYKVKPSKGIVTSKDGQTIRFELQTGFEEKEILNANHKCHKIQIHAFKWPDNTKEFQPEMWNRLEEKQAGDMQKITVNVELDGVKPEDTKSRDKKKSPGTKSKKGSSSKSKSESRKGKKRRKKEMEVGVQVDKDGTRFKQSRHLKISPPDVTFAMPRGKTQRDILTIESQSVVPIAFKVQTNKPDYYAVKPSKGLLVRGAQEKIEVECRSSMSKDNTLGGGHRFNVVSMPWPPTLKKFDMQLWTKFKQTRADTVCDVVIDVDFK